jgi:hypothetical protein
MDTFCLIYKAFADGFIALIVLWISACSISQPLRVWWKKQERKMKKFPRLRIMFGTCLALFCVSFVAVSIKVALIQANAQDPTKIRQQMLKNDALNFANQLSKFAASYDLNTDGATEFKDIFLDRFNEIAGDLSNEGLDTTKLYQLGHEQSPNRKQGENLMKIAEEIKKLALELPTKPLKT